MLFSFILWNNISVHYIPVRGFNHVTGDIALYSVVRHAFCLFTFTLRLAFMHSRLWISSLESGMQGTLNMCQEKYPCKANQQTEVRNVVKYHEYGYPRLKC